MSEHQKEEFINPIDKDKIAENPHLLPYAHTRGGVNIKPIDKGKVKGRAVTAMYEQTEMDLDQIRQQIELLASQAKSIQNRVSISERIYLAEMNFGANHWENLPLVPPRQRQRRHVDDFTQRMGQEGTLPICGHHQTTGRSYLGCTHYG